MIVHADDFGITAWQARAILSLSDVCGGRGALNSVSIFANSPAFEEAARLARPFVLAGRAAERKGDNVASDHAAGGELSSGTAEPDARPGRAEASGGLSIGLHLNLVEGPCCADPTTIPLLVDERGMFRNDFVRLLMMSAGPQRRDLAAQTKIECEAQIERFLQLFPEMRDGMRIDSHQHVHAIPLVFDALLAALTARGVRVERMRLPSEPLGPHRRCGTLALSGTANRAKALLLTWLCRRVHARVPDGCATPVFCGVVLSGKMSCATPQLARAFEEEASCLAAVRAARDHHPLLPEDAQVEMLFHPVSVPVEECLDPLNAPFASACASPERDEEAQTIRRFACEEPAA